MHKITKGSQIRYLLVIIITCFAFSSWKKSNTSGNSDLFLPEIIFPQLNWSIDEESKTFLNWSPPYIYPEDSYLASANISTTLNNNVILLSDANPNAIAKDITVQLDVSGAVSIQPEDIDDGSTATSGSLTYSINISDFDCSDVGTNTITLTVTDSSGNEDSDTAVVTVQDNVTPIALARNITVQLNNSGNASITAAQIDNGSNDACGIASLSLNKTTFTCANVGANTVTLTVTDNNGNSSTANATVTVEDNVAPSAIAQNITVQLNNSGNASITAAQIDNGSNDACGIASLSLNKTTFTCANVGANTVTLTVTDNNGNSSTANATVTVEDNVAPSAIAQNITVQLNNSGNASITAAQIDNGSNDACGIASLSLNKTTFTCANVGANTVTLTVTDNNGNSSTANATVTVEDNVAPSAIAQNITVQLNNSGNASITAAQIDNGSNDACGIASLSLNKTTFTCANVGANTVTLTVTDNNGNSSTANATVTVEDNVAPSAIAQNITVQLNNSGNASITAAQIDNGSNDACGIASLSLNKTTFTCANVGANTVTLTVTDNNGNSSTATATVTVEDNVAPIAIAQSITVQLDNTGNASITAAQIDNGSNDACGIASLSLNKTTFDCTNIGDNTVTLTVTDNNGKVSTATATVTVEDNVAPIAIAQSITVQLDNTGNASITAAQIDNGSNDACGIASLSLNKTTFDCTNIGDNTVTLTVTDNNGKVSTATATVTVEDNVAPIAIAQSITVQLDNTGNASITAAQIDNGSNDACGIASLSLNKTTFDCTNIGDNTVTLTVTDNNGKVSTATAIVTIQDITPPIIPTLQDIVWGCEYTVALPTTSDNCDTDITVTANRSTTFTSTGKIIWTFTDDSSNSSQSIEQTITINQISVSIDKTDILCFGASTGEVEAIVTGGVPPFTYDWGAQGTGSQKTGLNPGNYTVIVTDANGCTSTDSATITEPEIFVKINNISINTGCNGVNNASVEIDAEGGTGSLNYYLDGTLLTDNTASGLSHTTYAIEVRDENGCSATEVITIEEPDVLTVTEIKTTETIGFGSSTGTATAIVNGGTNPYTFTWLNNQDQVLPQTGQSAQNLEAGTYKLIVTDANNCSTNPVSFTIYDSLEGEISVSSKCMGDGGTNELRTSYIKPEGLRGGTGNYTLDWDFDSPMTISGPDEYGVYTVKYQNVGTKNLSLTITDSPNRIDSNGDIISHTATLNLYVGECFGKCTAQDLDVGDYYIGDPITGEPLSDTCDGTIKDIGIWVYLVLPSDNAKRYNYYREYIINVHNVSTDSITTLSSSDSGEGGICESGEVDSSVPQLITRIQNYDCNVDRILLEKLFISVSTGQNQGNCNVYSETNHPKCSGIDEPEVVQSPLAVSGNGSQILCLNNANGQITARAIGNQGDLQFTLEKIGDPNFVPLNSPIQTSANYVFSGLENGTYKITVQDNLNNDPNFRDGKTDTVDNIQVTPPDDPLQIAEVSRVGLACLNGNDAEVEVSASGGKAPYLYTWEDGRTGSRNANLSSGATWVRVIDDNGCENTLNLNIDAPAQVLADAGEDISVNCGVYKVQLNANFPSYTNPVSGNEEFGQWSVLSGNSGATFTNINSPQSVFIIQTTGTYTLQWTVPCGDTDEVKITFSNCSTLDFDGIDDHIDLGNNYNPTSNFTIEAWIRPLDLTGTKTILSKRDNSDLSKGGFDLIVENSKPKFRWNSTSISSDTIIKADRWYHIAVIKGNTDAGLYVDGIKVSSSGPGSPTSLDDRFLIGAVNTSTDLINPENFFKGWIEEVRIWDTSLTQKQLQFLMNQRVKEGVTPVEGTVIPDQNAYGLPWTSLKGYYRLIATDVAAGFTKDLAENKVDGRLINIVSTQKNTAPLPYISVANGDWNSLTTWKEPNDWDIPNSIGIKADSIIDWNIVRINHNIVYDGPRTDLKLLGLLSETPNKTLTITGSILENNVVTDKGTGFGLTISKYLRLDGIIDLNGNSQLVQTEGSILDEASSGYIDIDQQGTANSFNYNYWSSPVSNTVGLINSGFTIGSVLMDGSNPDNPKDIIFNQQYHWADGNYTGNKRISTYWLYNFGDPEDDFNGDANDYFSWSQFDETESLPPGIGYTMKGTTGYVPISTRQNYTFRGKPNNGDISVTVAIDQNLLTGNPYPSAIDALQFINENLSDFNGALYFWDHFGKEDSHYLEEYVGGYAVYNLSGGVSSASSVDSRINNNDESSQKEPPAQFIPVGQAFFINTLGVDNPLTITYKNKYRAFILESDQNNGNNLSQFHSQEKENPKENHRKASLDERHKIRLKFESPKGYHRQILVTADENTTSGFDLGYDAPLIENNVEDMYWMVDSTQFVIQAVPDFALERILPLGIKIAETGEFTIKIDETENIKSGFEIYLRDKTIDQYYKISEQDFTTAIEETGFFNDRFELVFRSQEENSEEEEEEEEKDGPVEETPIEAEKPELSPQDVFLGLQYYKNTDEIALSNPDLLNITQVEIYSISGQKIMSFNDIPTERSVLLRIRQKLSSAVYVVKLYSGKKVYSKKVIISK